MNYKLSELPNNLRVLIVSMPSFESATVSIWVRSGSRVEEERLSGLSHFLEHMAFKGGKKYPSPKKVSETIDAIGGEFNAGTSKETTKFYVKARVSHLETALDVLSDIVLHPQLKDKDIEREKKVILEELRMYEDTPIRRIWDLFEQLIFEGHELGRDVIGTQDSIKLIKREDLLNYRRKNYHSKNILIAIAGKIQDSELKKLVADYFKEVPPDGDVIVKSPLPLQAKPRLKLKYRRIEQAHFILGFPAEPLGAEERYKDSVMNSILGGGMSSRLFTQVREKRGLAYSVRSEIERFLDAGYFACYTGTDPSKSEEAMKVILDQFYGLFSGEYAVSKKELQKAKEFIKGHLALSLEDTAEVADFFAYEYLMLGKVKTPEEVFKNVDEVTEEDVVASAKKIFDPKKLNLCIIGPYKDQTKFEKILNSQS